MKITKQELEFRVRRELDNFYSYTYTPQEISREQTAYYFLIKDLKIYESEGGDLNDFKDNFLVKCLNEKNLKDEQRDFIIDILDFIDVVLD